MTGPAYTPAMLESALDYFHTRALWEREYRHGGYRVLFPSSRVRKEPMIWRASEDDCSCPGFSYHGGICSHVLAVKMEAEHLRGIARRPQKSVTAP